MRSMVMRFRLPPFSPLRTPSLPRITARTFSAIALYFSEYLALKVHLSLWWFCDNHQGSQIWPEQCDQLSERRVSCLDHMGDLSDECPPAPAGWLLGRYSTQPPSSG